MQRIIERTLVAVGSTAFGICAVPAAISAIQRGHDGSDWTFLLVWMLGESCMMVWVTLRREWILFLNYIPNFICLLIMMYYNGRL